MIYRRFFKRTLDVLLSSVALVILFPLLVLTALLVFISSSGPVFFLQARLGYKERIFRLYKFRTMTHKERKVDRPIYLGDAEVTRIGNYLRRFKIDELPQLINVLLGDMSIVGPRPCMPANRHEFNEDGMFRTQVKPGLTGLAQINGNIYLSWPDRWKYDRYYVEHVSFWMDLKILAKTVAIVVQGEKNFLNKPANNIPL